MRLKIIVAQFVVLVISAMTSSGCSDTSRSHGERSQASRRAEVEKLLGLAHSEASFEMQHWARDIIFRESARVMARAWDRKRAIATLQSIADSEERLNGYALVAKALSAAGCQEEAHTLIAQCLEASRAGEAEFACRDSMGDLAAVAAECGFVDWGLEILREAGEDRTTAYDVHQIAVCAAQDGKLQVAIGLMSRYASDGYEPMHRLLKQAAFELESRPAATRA
jgi:TPR repeat protein